MDARNVAGYGTWESPVLSELPAYGINTLTDIIVDDSDVYWIEQRPSEKGRSALMTARNGKIVDVLPEQFSIRTRVHEYGGKCIAISHGIIYFTNLEDQRIYKTLPGEKPVPITESAGMRYADFSINVSGQRLVCVTEDHSDGSSEAKTGIMSINTMVPDEQSIIESGSDFYSNPRVSPDGRKLLWLSWNHPDMPWDGTELWVADFDERGRLASKKRIAGSAKESIFQPEWASDGSIYFVSDRTDWWNLYCFREGAVNHVCVNASEFGRPQWLLGLRTYALVGDNLIACANLSNGIWKMVLLDVLSSILTETSLPLTSVNDIVVSNGKVYCIGGSFTEMPSLIEFDPSADKYRTVYSPKALTIDAAFVSSPVHMEFETSMGEKSFGLYYPPVNPSFRPRDGELPPLLIFSHGGPTSNAGSSLDMRIQYWTTRGFAVMDVNYRGSSGYGRKYRDSLNGLWGIADVDDCSNAAIHLSRIGLADPERLIIRGGSAGGYTTICALTFRKTFRTGASYYGISDLEALAKETHKFESRYLEKLVGPYPMSAEIYRQRSPLNYAENITCPVIFFQGLEDKVVPPNQSEKMVLAIRAKGIPADYVTFKGEGHGFRLAESIKQSLDLELGFYRKVLKLSIGGSEESPGNIIR